MEDSKGEESSVDGAILGNPIISSDTQEKNPDWEWAYGCWWYENCYMKEDSKSQEILSSLESSAKATPPIIEGIDEEVKIPCQKKEPESQQFDNFKTIAHGISPKKKHIRARLIKGHQSIIHKISQGIFKTKNPSEREIYNRLKTHFLENKDILEGLHTEFRSIADKLTQKSFDAAFIKKYFEHEATKVSFYYYIELIFLDVDPETLCKKFKFECCALRDHWIFCNEQWIELKNYLQQAMFTDLGILPWIPK